MDKLSEAIDALANGARLKEMYGCQDTMSEENWKTLAGQVRALEERAEKAERRLAVLEMVLDSTRTVVLDEIRKLQGDGTKIGGAT
jgi:hypothetical protein